MRLNAPKKNTWIVAVVIGVVGIIAKFVAIPFLSVYAFWLSLLKKHKPHPGSAPSDAVLLIYFTFTQKSLLDIPNL
jgi:hypothetical protein